LPATKRRNGMGHELTGGKRAAATRKCALPRVVLVSVGITAESTILRESSARVACSTKAALLARTVRCILFRIARVLAASDTSAAARAQ